MKLTGNVGVWYSGGGGERMQLSAFQIVTVTRSKDRVFTKLMVRWDKLWRKAMMSFYGQVKDV